MEDIKEVARFLFLGIGMFAPVSGLYVAGAGAALYILQRIVKKPLYARQISITGAAILISSLLLLTITGIIGSQSLLDENECCVVLAVFGFLLAPMFTAEPVYFIIEAGIVVFMFLFVAERLTKRKFYPWCVLALGMFLFLMGAISFVLARVFGGPGAWNA